MIAGRKVIVVMPAYNAELTLERTYRAIPAGAADEVVLTDDASGDRTVEVARRLGLAVIRHDRNRGYGANQKTCYLEALRRGADIVVMLHPDYQYDPRLIPGLVRPIAEGRFDIMLGSRMTDGSAVSRGMPLYKYWGNRLLTAWQNAWLGLKLSEYHTGYRAYARGVFEELPYAGFSDDFIFDNQLLVAAAGRGLTIGEIACPARYERDSSSIGLRRSLKYGLQVLWLSLAARRRARTKPSPPGR